MSPNHSGPRIPAIFRPAVLLFDGISGRDRRRLRQYKESLEPLRQESLRLSQERDALQKEVHRLNQQRQGDLHARETLQQERTALQQEHESLRQEIQQQRQRLQASSVELQRELSDRLSETQQLNQSLQDLRQEQEQFRTEQQAIQGQLRQALQEKSEQCDRLTQQLADLEGVKLQLEADLAEMEDWVQQISVSNTELDQENTVLEQSLGDRNLYFGTVVTQLEALEQRLRGSNTEAWQAFSEVWKSLNLETLFPLTPLVPTIDPPNVDLSQLSLALVGGHDATRRGVIELLSPYGLKQVVEIPPASQNKISQSRIKAKIQRCDMIVIIAGYLSHKLTDIIDNLNQHNALAGELLYLNCRGSSGVAREILLHLQNQRQAG